MASVEAPRFYRLLLGVALAGSAVSPLLVAEEAAAAPLVVVTPGEQNTQSAENGCAMTPCAAGRWLHYPELLQRSLGAGYAVQNNGDGGAVLGCDAASATAASNNSFCKNPKYTTSIATPPAIVVIGPFGEHDQRIITASAANQAALYNQGAFEAAYEGLIQDYLKFTMKIVVMTPIDVPWGPNTTALPAGQDLVKDIMLPAALKVAKNHSLTVVDTYTAITGTPALVTQYYDKDGQVNAAGQQKMADLVLAAITASSSGGSGGAGGSGAAAGSGGTGGTGGTASGGASGGGAAGVSAAAGTGGSAGSSVSAGGSAVAGGTSEPDAAAPSSSGCTVSIGSRSSAGFGFAFALMALAALGRRRKAD